MSRTARGTLQQDILSPISCPGQLSAERSLTGAQPVAKTPQMTGDIVDVARRVVEALERCDTAAVRAELAERLAGWDPLPWIAERWRPQLDEIAGVDRRVTGARRVSEVMARVVVDGDRGRAFVSVFLEDGSRVAGLGIDSDERDGRFGIVVGCTKEQAERLEPFYRLLTSGPIGFGEGGAQPPRGATRPDRHSSTSTCWCPTWTQPKTRS